MEQTLLAVMKFAIARIDCTFSSGRFVDHKNESLDVYTPIRAAGLPFRAVLLLFLKKGCILSSRVLYFTK